MTVIGATGIIADDLTGANDTALQFFLKGANTEIIFETGDYLQKHLNVGCWAQTTETRNIKPMEAAKIVWESAKNLKNFLGVENFYKKIDSTLRGNIAVETLAMLDAIEYDAAVIAPAFIQEGRITIGGYQLLKGVPIERTDAARDTYSPIFDSYIPDILKRQVSEQTQETIATIDFKTVAKGALAISNHLNELIQEGKKLIVADAVSSVDLEQIALATNKSKFNILPVGSAGLANAISSIWLHEANSEQIEKQFPILPKLILSGSKTTITSSQINKLSLEDDIENTYFIDLRLDDILGNRISEITDRIVNNLGKENVVVAHVSKLEDEIISDEGKSKLIDEGITREVLAAKITDFLAEVARCANQKSDFVLITIGGETSYKCTKAINCEFLQVVDGVLPSIPLCMNSSAKFVLTKSGNMGTASALIDIVKYFKNHEQK